MSSDKEELAASLAKAHPAIKALIARALPPERAAELGLIAEQERKIQEPPRGWRKWLAAIVSWIAVLLGSSVMIGAIVWRVHVSINQKSVSPASEPRVPTVEQRISAFKEALPLEAVLRWRQTYGNLLGRSHVAAIDRFGSPARHTEYVTAWEPSDKTLGRKVLTWLLNDKITAVEVVPKPTELFDFSEVMERGGFRFEATPMDMPDGRLYDVKVTGVDDHCEMKFTLNQVMFLESVKFK